jgi:hypothetical protein
MWRIPITERKSVDLAFYLRACRVKHAPPPSMPRRILLHSCKSAERPDWLGMLLRDRRGNSWLHCAYKLPSTSAPLREHLCAAVSGTSTGCTGSRDHAVPPRRPLPPASGYYGGSCVRLVLMPPAALIDAGRQGLRSKGNADGPTHCRYRFAVPVRRARRRLLWLFPFWAERRRRYPPRGARHLCGPVSVPRSSAVVSGIPMMEYDSLRMGSDHLPRWMPLPLDGFACQPAPSFHSTSGG